MQRRAFLGVLGGAVVWPLSTRAQQPQIPVVGFLNSGTPDAMADFATAFREGLKQTGYVEGQNVAIEYRWVEGRYDRLSALAADLVRRQVSVIFAGGGALTTLAAKAATSTIPIVFQIGDDPIKAGLVDNLNRPSGNVTGASFFGNELGAKRLALLRELVPAAPLAAVLVNPKGSTAEAHLNEVQVAARAVGQQILVLNVGSEQDLDAAFATLKEQEAKVLIVNADPVFFILQKQIVALAARYAVPAIYYTREFAMAGGLMSYGTSILDATRQAGVYCGKILKGARVADLPVLLPTKFEYVVNLKTLKTLGLNIPPTLLALADEVIE